MALPGDQNVPCNMTSSVAKLKAKVSVEINQKDHITFHKAKITEIGQ